MSGLLDRIDRTPLVATVMERVRGLIASGDYPPGTKLPSERELQEHFGVGRSTVREALRALEALGLIELKQGRGALVTQRESGPPAGAEAVGREAWRIERVAEARLVIETQAAALAALRRTESDLAQLEQELQAFADASSADDLSALVRADVSFHDAIAAAANPVLASSLKSMEVLGIQSRSASLGRRSRRTQVLARHRSIFDSIRDRDPVAAGSAMRLHLTDFVTELGLTVVDWGGEEQAGKRVEFSKNFLVAVESRVPGTATALPTD